MDAQDKEQDKDTNQMTKKKDSKKEERCSIATPDTNEKKIAVTKKPTTHAVLLTLLMLALLATSFYLYRHAHIKQVIAPPKPLSKEELVKVQETFMKTFRPGCPLSEKSTFTFQDGIVVSGYFASCDKEMPQRTYTQGLLNGRDVIFEKSSESTSTIPVISVYGRVSDVSSSTVFLRALGEAQVLRDKELATMKEGERKEADALRSYFSIAGQYVVLYQVGKDGVYFDQTSLTVSMSAPSGLNQTPQGMPPKKTTK